MASHKLVGNRDFGLEVVGESHYQESFESICGARKAEGENLLVEAHLIPEPDNQFDRNAVRVEVQGKQVGYLPRAEAKDYLIILGGLKIPINTVILVDGNIRGGRIRKGELGYYGIWLDFPTDERGAIQLKAIAKKARKKGCCGLFLFIPLFFATLGLLWAL